MDKFYIPLSRYKNMVKRSTITNTLAGILISTASNIYSQNAIDHTHRQLPSDKGIEFEKDTIWENILEKAKKEDKLIFLDVYTDWCIPCKKMEKEVFTNDSVADFYNANFVNARINPEKSIIGKELAKNYEIRFYPTFLFMDGKGELSHRATGSMESSTFIKIGKRALDLEKKISAFNKELKNKKDGKAVYEYIQRLDEANLNYSKTLEDYFKTQKEEEMTSEINWKIISFDKTKEKIDSKHFKFLLENKEKFDSLYTIDSVDTDIFQSYSKNLLERLATYYKDHVKVYEIWIDEVKKSKFHRLDEVLLEGKVDYNRQIMNWNSLTFKDMITLLDSTKRGEEIKRDYDVGGYSNAGMLNNYAWDVFQNTENKEFLEKALNWAERSIEIKESSYNIDTYACLLYSLGRKEEAIFYEEKAIQMGIEEYGRPDKRYTEKIIKMKKGEKIKQKNKRED